MAHAARSRKRKVPKMDLSVFKTHHHVEQCKQDSDDPIEGCKAIKRLIWTLKYYTLLDIIKNKFDQDIFAAFICEIYTQCLDDYSHLVNEHHNLEQIHDVLKAKKLFGSCDINECSFTMRHHSEDTKVSMDEVVKFYANTMDSLHFYMLHLFECGLRIQKTNANEATEQKHGDNDHRYFDAQFSRVRRIIHQRQNICTSFNRLNNNNRFNINIQPQSETVTSYNTRGFNVGLLFYYWSHYRTMDILHPNYSCYKISDLFVKQKFDNFKQEIGNYQFITFEQYECLMIKVKEYINTQSVKQRKARHTLGANYDIILKYGIDDGAALLSRHLLSIFLYTDFVDLCTDFRTTFHQIKQFEPLSSIKARHSKYHWLAKCLREVVELYGRRMVGAQYNQSKQTMKTLLAPIYCVLSSNSPFPELHARLCGPTSSSKQIEIVTRFVGDKGTIIQFTNSVASCLSGFQCGWLSKYKEENEVLCIGGHHLMKIESARVLKGKHGLAQNFEWFFNVLRKFDGMFNGGYVDQIHNDEKELIRRLVGWRLGSNEMKDDIDAYILDTFETFCQHKRHIVFRYCLLDNSDKELRDMIFYGMNKSGADWKPSPEVKTNVFRKELFKIFANMQRVDIHSTSDDGYHQCAFSFASLLSEIEKESVLELRIKAIKTRKKSWISISKEIMNIFRQKGYEISVQTTRNERNFDEDCVVIKTL